MPVEGDDARAQGAVGLEDPGRRRLDARQGPGHVRRHHVLGVAELDDGLRLVAPLLLDPREVADPEVLRAAT